MSGRLDRRLTMLERAPGAGGVDFRVFATLAEADADIRPAGPEAMKVVHIITGVYRAPGPT